MPSTYHRFITKQPRLLPWSRLYSLAPIGIGSPLVESQTSYIARLSIAHNLSVGVLFGYELAPLAGKEFLRRAASRTKYPCSIFASAFQPCARAMNGLGVIASDWVDILQSLTLRTDLRFMTMLTWEEVMPQNRLLRTNRAWCPTCYEDWQTKGEVIYEPLLWAISVANICPLHHRALRTVCNHCNEMLPPLTSKSRPGFCSKCGQWLGEKEAIELSLDGTLSEQEFEWQNWAATSVGNLIAMAPKLENMPTRDGVIKSLTTYMGEYLGHLPQFAQAININHSTAWHWRKGKSLPQLNSLLRLCRHLGVSLLDVVTGKFIKGSSVLAGKSVPKRHKREATRRRPLDKPEAERVLRASLKEVTSPSLQDVAARLDRNGNTLRYWFSELCKEVVAKHRTYRRESLLSDGKNIGTALQQVIDESPPPSMRAVARQLGYDIKTLIKHFPDLSCEITERHKAHNKTIWEDRKKILLSAWSERPPPSVLGLAKRLGLSVSSLYEHFPDLCHEVAAQRLAYRRSQYSETQKVSGNRSRQTA